MKKFLALVLALVMTMSLVTIGANATDVGYSDDSAITNVEAVEVLNALGIMGGYPDGSFRPQANLTRGAGAKLIAYLVLGQAAADKLKATYTVFSDVTDGVGLAAYIEWAAANGIVDGYGDGNFGPYNTLTEYAFGKMLLGALGYDSAREGYVGAGWQKNVYAKATALGIYDGSETYGACNRDTAARMTLGALKSRIVVYGDAEINGRYYWNGQEVTGASLSTVKDTAIELPNFLYDIYGAFCAEFDADIFDRPGHSWYYGSWSKFYADAPVLEYTTKVDWCTILQDLGIAKTSKAQAYFDYYSVNGVESNVGYEVGHINCGAGQYGPTGQGVLTQVFERDGEYIITVIDTYLAKVVDVRDAAHGKNGPETKLEVYVKGNGQERSLNEEGTIVLVEGIQLTKGDYVLVNLCEDRRTEWDNYLTDEDYEVMDGGFYYANILGSARTVEGKLEAKTTEAAMTLTVGETDYPAARQYELTESWLALGSNQIWFLDQYGNIIGDINPESAAPKYGRIDALKWVNDGTVSADEYVSANLVTADGSTVTESEVVLGTWNDAEGAGADYYDDAGEIYSDYYYVSEVKAENYEFYARGNKYGVVAYDADYNVWTAGELLAYDSKHMPAGPYNGYGYMTLTNGQVTLGYTANGQLVYADNATQFLVDTGYGYEAYLGINNLPTMNWVTDVVVVTNDAANSGTKVQAYAEFVFVYAPTAVYAGETVEAYVINTQPIKYWNSGYAAPYYEYEIWVNGERSTIFSAYVPLEFSAGAGVYEISFDAGSWALEAVACSHYEDKTANRAGDGTVNGINVSRATVYLVDGDEIVPYTAAEIATGDTLKVKLTADSTGAYKVADTIYVIG